MERKNEQQAHRATLASIIASLLVLVAITWTAWRVEQLRTDPAEAMRWSEVVDGRTIEIEVRARPGETLEDQYQRLKLRWRVATRKD